MRHSFPGIQFSFAVRREEPVDPEVVQIPHSDTRCFREEWCIWHTQLAASQGRVLTVNIYEYYRLFFCLCQYYSCLLHHTHILFMSSHIFSLQFLCVPICCHIGRNWNWMVPKGNGTNHLEKPRCSWDRSHFSGVVHFLSHMKRLYSFRKLLKIWVEPNNLFTRLRDSALSMWIHIFPK